MKQKIMSDSDIISSGFKIIQFYAGLQEIVPVF